MSLPLATLKDLQKLSALKGKGVILERQYEVIKKHVTEGNSLTGENWEAFDLAWELRSSGFFRKVWHGDDRINLEGLDKPYSFMSEEDSDDEEASETRNAGSGEEDDQRGGSEGDHDVEGMETRNEGLGGLTTREGSRGSTTGRA